MRTNLANLKPGDRIAQPNDCSFETLIVLSVDVGVGIATVAYTDGTSSAPHSPEARVEIDRPHGMPQTYSEKRAAQAVAGELAGGEPEAKDGFGGWTYKVERIPAGENGGTAYAVAAYDVDQAFAGYWPMA